MATHFSILVWKVLWTAEPGRLQRVGHDCAYTIYTHTWDRRSCSRDNTVFPSKIITDLSKTTASRIKVVTDEMEVMFWKLLVLFFFSLFPLPYSWSSHHSGQDLWGVVWGGTPSNWIAPDGMLEKAGLTERWFFSITLAYQESYPDASDHIISMWCKEECPGNSLTVQWLGLGTFITPGFNPSSGN